MSAIKPASVHPQLVEGRLQLVTSMLALSLMFGGCGFNPDLSRFDPCTAEGSCPAGFLCLAEAQRCVPECGENCPLDEDAGFDAGRDAGLDSGTDAGTDAGADAGTDAGTDAGDDAGTSDAGEDAGVIDAGPFLTLATRTLPAAIETQPYSQTFVPTNGVPPYAFSIDGGVPGFSLSTGGVLATSAAPTAGTFPFSITVKDEAMPTRAQVTTPFSLEVRPFLRVANSLLFDGRVGQPYLQQLSATGGVPPYRWVVDGGVPPGGTSLSDAGVLQGSPNLASTVNFGVTVSDSATPPQQASRMVTVQTVLLDLLATSIATPSAADGRVGTPYNQPLKAYGGTGTYTWSIQPGSSALPPGITLVNAGSAFSLQGTPTAAGTFNFSIACDSNLNDPVQPISITIY